MARGTLIVFEGLDRAGKSTQCEKLVASLQRDGISVRYMRFPDRTTPVGRMIDSYLGGQSEQDDHTIHLLFSANRWEAAPSIKADLDTGTTVVIDRYYYSGCVYSAAKQNPSMSLEWCYQPEVGLPRPDLCIFLDIATEQAEKRGGFGAEKYEKKEMQVRVRELFEALVKRKEGSGGDFVRIDAGKAIEDVHAEVRAQVGKCMDRVDRENSLVRTVEPW